MGVGVKENGFSFHSGGIHGKVKHLIRVLDMSLSSNFKASNKCIKLQVFEENGNFFPILHLPFEDDIIRSLLDMPYWGCKNHKVSMLHNLRSGQNI